MVTVKELKNFMMNIPDDASVVFSDGCITVLFNENARALNKWGAIWDNGIGYPRTGTSCCGECSHFQCDVCDLCNFLAKVE